MSGTVGSNVARSSGIVAAAEGGGPSKGTDHIIRTNALTISENITIDATENGMTAGPVTIASSYTVTVASGATWSIV
jgi:hypothetical protein